jgi:hypothetical protein
LAKHRKKTIKAKTFCGDFANVCDTPVEAKPEAGKERERQADKRHGNEKLLDLSFHESKIGIGMSWTFTVN